MMSDELGPVEVTALDHVYVSVSDLARAETFYDPIMRLLGFKKGKKPIAGEPHIHYFNRVMQYTIRPARGGEHDPYGVGSLHHLCFRVRDRATVDDVSRRVRQLGVDATGPRVYEYRPDYYATFFDDPDGIRLEVVCDTELRRMLRARWYELDGFEDPLSKLGPVAAPASVGNLSDGIPDTLPDELIDVIATGPDVRVERIVSRGHASEPEFWYDQDEHEIVFVISGRARLEIERDDTADLGPGDWVHLRPHCKHRVAWTTPDTTTIWLAVFWPA